jgi:ribosome-binding protein aMBF1 (putative translation factor)
MTLIRFACQKLIALARRTAEIKESEGEEADETYQWMGAEPLQITPVQVRMARAALGWSVRELGEKVGVTASTVRRIENGSGVKQSTIAAIRSALESAGVEFIAEHGEGIGVKFRKGAAPDADSIRPD